MSRSALTPVQFHDDTIFVIEKEQQPFAPMKPIIENMGIAWRPQATKLRSNSDRWGVMMIITPSRGGSQKYLCIPVRKLPGFLATINPNKVRPELRSKIIRYQQECDDALWSYWSKGTRDARPISIAQQKEIRALVDKRVRAVIKGKSGVGVYGREYARWYRALRAKFQVQSYKDILISEFDDAVAFLTDKKKRARIRHAGDIKDQVIKDLQREVEELSDIIVGLSKKLYGTT